MPHFYDTPDSYKTNSLRVDASPPGGGVAGSDPDFAAKQLLVDAGVSIAVLEPMCDAQLPQAEHVLKATYNDWLADVWLGDNNWHGRWRGAISVTAQDPEQAAREIERWAGHPYMAEVLMTPQTRGIPFGSPHFDPLYEAAARNGLPVATHLMGQTPFELIPIYPVGNPAHWHDFFASWPLLYVSHLMSLVFDGAFDRHPDLRVVFVEGGFTWAMPVMSRMDRIWEHRKADLPHVRRRAVGLRPRARAVHHAAARGGQRRGVPGVHRNDGPRRQHHVLHGLSALELRRTGLGDQAVPRRSARADHARQRHRTVRAAVDGQGAPGRTAGRR